MESILTWTNIMRVIDVGIVAYLIYVLITFSQHTRVVNLFKGVLFIVVIKIISEYLTLYTLGWIIDQVIVWGVIAVIIIFQPEIRLYLGQLGQNKLFMKKKSPYSSRKRTIDELSKAVQYLSKRSIGALISLEMGNSLKSYSDTGVKLEAFLSSQLLINVFIPNTPLHDGATIIKNHKIQAASCVLPLSEDTSIPQELGTRHRAAIGLSEHTDALTIVVSEETGDISVSYKGTLHRKLTIEQLEALLTEELIEDISNNKQRRFENVSALLKMLRKGGK
ncbi:MULTISPECIES: diadenylate cyclase CdaA [unclassified Granulicatella]|uniref:diadenylate cyclase CdaA n=1 Tax=unclassified Granulicatella TaxID=2630493 RepID=UPI00107321CF|nr:MULTISPECIES: diadenylate cyclase CdaA [unclassified Granulicatella]MBF0780296.1 TIGR00159 family protein [Granulicatella sp. 19428wC4_WM01]TFU95574.1 TIGR00159 family protein [Granulicatella sp. WM01]